MKVRQSTLTSVADSRLDSKFSGRFPIDKEPDGTVFIDRDPVAFREVINYLRNGAKLFDLRDDLLTEKVKSELIYWLLIPDDSEKVKEEYI